MFEEMEEAKRIRRISQIADFYAFSAAITPENSVIYTDFACKQLTDEGFTSEDERRLFLSFFRESFSMHLELLRNEDLTPKRRIPQC